MGGKGKGKEGAKGESGKDVKGSSRAQLRAQAEEARAAQKKGGEPAETWKEKAPARKDPPEADRWSSLRSERRDDPGKGRWSPKGKDSGYDSRDKGSSKGKGKGYDDYGKGKGSGWDDNRKGKGKSKGDKDDGYGRGGDGCFTCGGPHLARDCPQKGEKGAGKAMNVRDFEARMAKDMGGLKAMKGEGMTEAEIERETISKKVSWLLRRGAASVGLTLSDNGWAKMSELTACSTFNEMKNLSLDKFMLVINESNKEKPRYELKQSEEGLMIRSYTKEERKDLEDRGELPQNVPVAPPAVNTQMAIQATVPPTAQQQQAQQQQALFMQQQQAVAQQQFMAHQMAAQQQMAQASQQQYMQMAAQQVAMQQAAQARAKAMAAPQQQQGQQQQLAMAALQQQQPQQQQPGQPPANYANVAQAFQAAGAALAAALKMPTVPGQPGVETGNVVGVPLNSAGTAPASTSAPSGSTPANAPVFMSAAAPTFTPLEQQHNQWQQAQAAQVQLAQQNAAMTQMWYSNNSAEQAPAAFNPFLAPAASRALHIIDPNSGENVAPTPAPKSALDYLEVKAPARKAMTIVDPSSGKAVDTFTAVNFQPAVQKKLEIIDPNSGSSVKI